MSHDSLVEFFLSKALFDFCVDAKKHSDAGPAPEGEHGVKSPARHIFIQLLDPNGRRGLPIYPGLG